MKHLNRQALSVLLLSALLMGSLGCQNDAIRDSRRSQAFAPSSSVLDEETDSQMMGESDKQTLAQDPAATTEEADELVASLPVAALPAAEWPMAAWPAVDALDPMGAGFDPYGAAPAVGPGPFVPITPVTAPLAFAQSPFFNDGSVPPWQANYIGSYGVLPTRYAAKGPFLYSFDVDDDLHKKPKRRRPFDRDDF